MHKIDDRQSDRYTSNGSEESVQHDGWKGTIKQLKPALQYYVPSFCVSHTSF
jgi:hypothetical protein